MQAVMTKEEGALPVLKLSDITTVTARLAQILAEEVDLLSEMKISAIEKLQKEKLLLVQGLESQRKQLRKHPEVQDGFSEREKAVFRQVIDVFNAVLEENRRRLQMAKEVNLKVIEAIKDVVRKADAGTLYDEQGYPEWIGSDRLCVTLNKKV